MFLTKQQKDAITSTFETLFERVRDLRDNCGHSAPPDREFELLFTDIDDYEVDHDSEVTQCLDFIYGMAIGLGFWSTADLYNAYRKGLDRAEDLASIQDLVQASDRALTPLARTNDKAVREVVHALGRAIAPFKGRKWS